MLLAELLQQTLPNTHYASLTVTSNSMVPLLYAGDQVLLVPASIEQLRPGDIVTIIDRTQSYLLTHRYWGAHVQRQGTHLITRGDRPLAFDTPCPSADLIGRVIVRRRQGRDLPLTHGPGGWLNRQLARLVAAEWRQLTGTTLAQSLQLAGPAGCPTTPPSRAATRFVRRLYLLAAVTLTVTVTLPARLQRPPANLPAVQS